MKETNERITREPTIKYHSPLQVPRGSRVKKGNQEIWTHKFTAIGRQQNDQRFLPKRPTIVSLPIPINTLIPRGRESFIVILPLRPRNGKSIHLAYRFY